MIERLQARAESDGIFVALKGVCAANVWKPKQLANMIVKGPGALKMERWKEGAPKNVCHGFWLITISDHQPRAKYSSMVARMALARIMRQRLGLF